MKRLPAETNGEEYFFSPFDGRVCTRDCATVIYWNGIRCTRAAARAHTGQERKKSCKISYICIESNALTAHGRPKLTRINSLICSAFHGECGEQFPLTQMMCRLRRHTINVHTQRDRRRWCMELTDATLEAENVMFVHFRVVMRLTTERVPGWRG